MTKPLKYRQLPKPKTAAEAELVAEIVDKLIARFDHETAARLTGAMHDLAIWRNVLAMAEAVVADLPPIRQGGGS